MNTTASLALESWLVAIEGGYRLEMYENLSGDPTIGAGHRWKPGDKTQITLAQAQQLFHQDLQVAVNAVKDMFVGMSDQREVDTLISGVFNLGSGSFHGTHFLSIFNSGNKLEAMTLWTQFCHYEGKPLAGLLSRRATELLIYSGHEVEHYGN